MTPLLLLSLAHAQDPQPPAEPEVPAVHQRMAEHYLIATNARAAVLRGDLDEVKAQGKKLASLGSDGMPATWKPHLDAISQAGRDLSSTSTLPMAGQAYGRIATECATCHATLEGGPQLSGDSAPPPGWTPDTHMPRHMWASEWIWLGILANDDVAVLRGAEVLAADPAVNPSPTHDPLIAEREAEVHRIAKEMVGATDLAGRRALYGDLIAQCGSCHLRLEAEGGTP